MKSVPIDSVVIEPSTSMGMLGGTVSPMTVAAARTAVARSML